MKTDIKYITMDISVGELLYPKCKIPESEKSELHKWVSGLSELSILLPWIPFDGQYLEVLLGKSLGPIARVGIFTDEQLELITPK